MFYVCCNTNDAICNYNHVAKVAEYFLKKEPDLCMNFILHYNIPFKLLQNVDFEFVQKLFLALFNCSETTTGIGEEAYKRLIKFCSLTDFFLHYTNAILLGEKAIDTKKFDMAEKPPGVEELVDIHHEYELSNTKDEKSHPQIGEPDRRASLIEEIGGIKGDIDGILPTIKGKKKVDKKQILSASPQKKQDSNTKKQLDIRYPSLLAKRLAEIAEEEKNENLRSVNLSQGSISQDSKLVTQNDPNASRDSSKTIKGKNILIKSNKNLKAPIQSSTQQSSPKSNLSFSSPKKSPIVSTIITISHGFHYPASHAKPIPNQQNPTSSSIDNLSAIVTSKRDSINTSKDEKAVPNKVRTPSQTQSELSKVTPSNANTNININASQFKSISRKASDHNDPTRSSPNSEEQAPPQRKTIINDFDKEVMGKKEMRSLYQLYPYSSSYYNKNIQEDDIEKESKQPEYQVNAIKANDAFSLALCDLLEILFRKTLSVTESQKLRKVIGLPEINYGPFWDAFFSDSRFFAFKLLMKNYLIKIKIHHLQPINSGYSSGVLVNMILTKW